jgi:hypothetical protein
MSGYTRASLIVGAIVATLLLETNAANAQFAPRRNFGRSNGNYYNYDSGYYPDINATNAMYQQAWTQHQQFQAQTADTRTAAWQSINQSAAAAANARTQSMMAQRQSSQDWWFQQQSRKLAESKANAAYQPVDLSPLEYNDPAVRSASPTPQNEIMMWPTLLRDPMFDALRAKVEAPFRRAAADKKPMTADDYRGILQALGAMKTELKGLSSQVVESEYSAVESYLDELTADAQKRLDARLQPKPTEEKEKSAGEKS